MLVGRSPANKSPSFVQPDPSSEENEQVAQVCQKQAHSSGLDPTYFPQFALFCVAKRRMGISMLRDLWIGGVLGIGFYWWRTQTQRLEMTGQQAQDNTQQLQLQLTKAQQELAAALAQKTTLETQIAELNQIATDRAIDLIQLQADNADLIEQIVTLSQKRTRKKRAVKVVEELNEVIASDLSTTPESPVDLEAIPTPFTLNLDLIQAKQLESIEANQLLQSVFIEDPIATSPTGTSPSLDSAHSAFLQTLRTQTLWSREDLMRVAQQLDLLLDGALELINEAAFDRCDEALTEGEDPLEVNPNVLQELLS
jgi:chromosome segregation ATPase